MNVWANDELPAKVINVPCNSEYRSCLTDTVPVRELEHGVESDIAKGGR